MKQFIILLLVVVGLSTISLAQGWGPKYPHSGTWQWSQDGWWGSDKMAHRVGSHWLGMEYQSWINNKWLAAGLALSSGVVWEIKDGYVNWQDFGAIGGDGFSYKDIVADAIGVGYSLHLFDPMIERPMIQKIKTTAIKIDSALVIKTVSRILTRKPTKIDKTLPRIEKRIFEPKPSKIILGVKLTRLVVYTGSWILASGVYNKVTQGKFYPHGTEWSRYAGSGSKKFLVTHDAEVSLMIPLSTSAMYRDHLNLGWRIMLSGVILVGYEALNATFYAADVPFIGDKENGGWVQGSINTGFLAIGIMSGWELLFHPKETDIVKLKLTPEGLGLGASTNRFAWSITPGLNSLGLNINF